MFTAVCVKRGESPSRSSRTGDGARWARLLRFVGPATLVSVGYMDPGNWATDLEGGSRFGYRLLWVLVISNGVALLLQTLATRLGVVADVDLASACRREYSPSTSFVLWVQAEVSMIACDLAEILGCAVALQLLFGLPLIWGALLTGIDVLLLLGLRALHRTLLESVVLTLVTTIGVCLLIELCLARPGMADVARGLLPSLPAGSAIVCVGIVGATVMPHNLYLHSSLVKSQGSEPARAPSERSSILRRHFWSTAIALNLAWFVNAGILVLSAAAFSARGGEVTDLGDAHRLLSPLLGSGLASTLFAVGLLCAGQSATISGTIAGQVVMQGFVRLRVSPILRRSLTRGMAIIPAVGVLLVAGETSTTALLIGSQVVLSLQLPFAVVPLLRFTNAHHLMGDVTNGRFLRAATALSAIAIVGANAALVWHAAGSVGHASPLAAHVLEVVAVASLGFLAWIAFVPLRGIVHDAPGEGPALPGGALSADL